MKPLYQRRGITIYHGDARKLESVIPPVDFIFTDPPYGHNNNNGDLIANRERALGAPAKKTTKPRPISGDSFDLANRNIDWLFQFAARKLRCCCCCCCCCGGGGPDPQFARWAIAMDHHLHFKQMVVWDKGPMGMGWHYRRSYETVLVAQKGKGKCRWFDQTHKVENIIRPGSGIKKIIPSSRQHPTEKPPELAELFIRLHSEPGDMVLDPFMGAGSTLIAARRTGRRAIGIEISKRWCNLAIEKLEAMP